MSLFIFLTVVQALIAAALVGVILIQKSEGGGLGVGGNPAGFMSARGAADFLTRATTVLATAFVVLSIVLAALAVKTTGNREIDTSLDRTVPAAPAAGPAAVPGPVAPVPAPSGTGAAPVAPDPLAAVQPGGATPRRQSAPAEAPSAQADPLKGAAKQ